MCLCVSAQQVLDRSHHCQGYVCAGRQEGHHHRAPAAVPPGGGPGQVHRGRHRPATVTRLKSLLTKKAPALLKMLPSFNKVSILIEAKALLERLVLFFDCLSIHLYSIVAWFVTTRSAYF